VDRAIDRSPRPRRRGSASNSTDARRARVAPAISSARSDVVVSRGGVTPYRRTPSWAASRSREAGLAVDAISQGCQDCLMVPLRPRSAERLLALWSEAHAHDSGSRWWVRWVARAFRWPGRTRRRGPWLDSDAASGLSVQRMEESGQRWWSAGELARVASVTVRALRHYDELGLLEEELMRRLCETAGLGLVRQRAASSRRPAGRWRSAT
jgi:hypothetical protein